MLAGTSKASNCCYATMIFRKMVLGLESRSGNTLTLNALKINFNYKQVCFAGHKRITVLQTDHDPITQNSIASILRRISTEAAVA